MVIIDIDFDLDESLTDLIHTRRACDECKENFEHDKEWDVMLIWKNRKVVKPIIIEDDTTNPFFQTLVFVHTKCLLKKGEVS